MDENTVMRTYSGILFDYNNMNENMINIEDISTSLSMKCRMNGHTSLFYSVAQHSVILSKKMNNSLAALLHDASECYLSDIPTPLKKLLPDYIEIENKLNLIIEKKFNVVFDEKIKELDLSIMLVEHKCLFNNIPPFELWNHNRAKYEFLKQYQLCIK